jgi:hypothetical protein
MGSVESKLKVLAKAGVHIAPTPAAIPVACPRKTLPSAPGFRYNPHNLWATPLQDGAGRSSSTRFTRGAASRGRVSVLRGARRIKACSFCGRPRDGFCLIRHALGNIIAL